jgi:lipopolysaccharide transport system ATP-binding protein
MRSIIEVNNISKQYRLGTVGTGSLNHDINRWWHRVRGKDDPYLKIGESNDRAVVGTSDYVWALRDISFGVQPGEVLGIIGRNGAGKSTLLKILSRITTPSIGSVTLRGRVASLLEVGTGMHPDLTGRENIYLNGAILGMRKKEIERKFDEIVDFAGVARYIDTPVKRYSSGMHVRLGFAVAAHLEPDILIVDEVLAVGDVEFQEKCIGKMKQVSAQDGRTVLFVSHQLQAISKLCTRVIVLKDGTSIFDGNVQEGLLKYRENYKVDAIRMFDKGPLSQVEVKQVGTEIILQAHYRVDEGLDIPNLGFVMYNAQGNPVYGSNPVLDFVPADNKRTYKSGTVTAIIREPKLLDGDYMFSLFFGDSKEDYLKMEDCLQLKVTGMVKKRNLDPSIIGNVEPHITWQIA